MNVEATINLQTAAARIWDVTVVGAGPSGALAARQLAQLGRRVLLVDKASFPRTKVCGCCLNQSGQKSLQAAGLGNLVTSLGAVDICQLRVGSGSRQAELPLQGTVGLSRQALDSALVTAAVDAGSQFLPQTEARLGATSADGRIVRLRQRERHEELQTRVLVAADGVSGGLMKGSDEIDSIVQENSRIGAGVIVDCDPSLYRQGTIYMACGEHGYVGLVRLENHQLDIAAAFDRKPVKQAGGLGPLAAEVLREADFPEIPNLDRRQWQGTPLLTRQSQHVYAKNAFLVGDAAGYVEPFTGEGMAWALAGGLAVAPIACRAVDGWDSSLGEEWSRVHRQVIRRRQWLCRALSRGLRHPRLTHVTIRVLSQFPILATPFIRSLAEPSSTVKTRIL
ncbi:MAG: NAD(P)/FAD-dependent oxidoreductase [Pirellulaceae bacterium]